MPSIGHSFGKAFDILFLVIDEKYLDSTHLFFWLVQSKRIGFVGQLMGQASRENAGNVRVGCGGGQGPLPRQW